MPSPQDRRSAALRVKKRTSCAAMERGSIGFEDITYAANGVDEFFLKGIVHLCAQTPHDDINDVRVGIEIDAPNVFGDLFARNNFARGSRELRQKQEFFRREIESNSAAHRAMTAGVDLQIIDAQLAATARVGAAQHGTNAREQFRKRERFY